jgi:hypothetical protein
VPTSLQSVLQAQFSALDSAELKILGTPTAGAGTSTSKGAGPRRTAPPAMLVGAVGLLGGAMAAM